MNIRTAIVCAAAVLLTNRLNADTLTVLNTDDAGAGSLRQAITDANAHSNSLNPGSAPDTISFNIPGAGVHTISVASTLPSIPDPVIIDGYTQPGATTNTLAVGDNAALLIELNGSLTPGANGLSIGAGNSTVRGLVINRFANCIILSGPAGGNVIEGNFIGTNPSGTGVFTTGNGIYVSVCSDNTIGGASPGSRNLISGCDSGVIMNGFGRSTASNNSILGNYIGTDKTGTVALSNTSGIALSDASTSNTIGGTAPGAGNLISGNAQYGIGIFFFLNASIAPNGNLIQGNFIGTSVTGTSPLGNGLDGIAISKADSETIGGTTAGAGNRIAFNGGRGINTGLSTGDSILGNAIFSNGSLGIDLGGNGVTANDTGDSDTGDNNLQNFPVLASVSSTGGNTTIAGTLNSTANTAFRIEFFANDEIDPSGFGEGKTFIGFTSVPTDSNGNGSFNVSFPQVAGEPHITATATDPNGNTSEFSAAIGQLLNISTRLRVLTGDNVLIGGFIITGSDDKHVIVRGIGPSLTSQGVPGALQDPTLELHDGTGALIASNDNWKDTQQLDIEVTGIPPTNDLESAIVATLPANGSGYTAILRGKNNTTGVGLVEAYDLNRTVNSKLANISTRGFVDTGDNVMIGGFIAGNGLTKVIVRAIGPSLTSQGVPGALQDPTLELHDGSGTTIASNDNWKDAQQTEIEATTIPPTDDRESAIVASLSPGNYTAIVRGKNDTTGVALVEVYNIP
jgi:hypothetical protein